MSPKKSASDASSRRLTVLFALVPMIFGAAIGYVLRTSSASACSCISYSAWTLHLSDPEATDSMVDDRAVWPVTARVTQDASGALLQRTDGGSGISTLRFRR